MGSLGSHHPDLFNPPFLEPIINRVLRRSLNARLISRVLSVSRFTYVFLKVHARVPFCRSSFYSMEEGTKTKKCLGACGVLYMRLFYIFCHGFSQNPTSNQSIVFVFIGKGEKVLRFLPPLPSADLTWRGSMPLNGKSMPNQNVLLGLQPFQAPTFLLVVLLVVV